MALAHMLDVLMSDKSLTTHADHSVTLSAQRQAVCLEATYQIESLSALLATLVPMSDETLFLHHAVRGIAGRIAALNSVLMGGIDDGGETVRRLSHIVSPNSKEDTYAQ